MNNTYEISFKGVKGGNKKLKKVPPIISSVDGTFWTITFVGESKQSR
ncbi:hypothetical protein GWZ74_00075 [Vibrio cholerae]|nr:hypothetical protein [Vibrio cholerae]NOE84021.1 hypothetical protein [Vibrio cholerae]NOE94317.1 hypothetical protein [Vibrio cholerae]NOE99450.1 hypothetical protein [Vibrio cholerae]NOF13231.1 hypothetical protein [Vibrio cholerae]NOF16662.1 hypothetical protein [Vibrio cholerae]